MCRCNDKGIFCIAIISYMCNCYYKYTCTVWVWKHRRACYTLRHTQFVNHWRHFKVILFPRPCDMHNAKVMKHRLGGWWRNITEQAATVNECLSSFRPKDHWTYDITLSLCLAPLAPIPQKRLMIYFLYLAYTYPGALLLYTIIFYLLGSFWTPQNW